MEKVKSEFGIWMERRVFLPIEFGLSFNKVGGATVIGFELGDVMM